MDRAQSTSRRPDDLDPLEVALLDRVEALSTSGRGVDRQAAPGHHDALTVASLLEAQIGSRVIDHTARWLRTEHGIGYYTIGSAGHESNAAVALALRPTDPALLHYRSGGFYFARSGQVSGQDPIGDVLRGMLALTTDQISGGRHKVFGNHSLAILPQTSTIASHLPRAVGLAVSLGRESSVHDRPWPDDSVVVCSFGDASLNHSTTQGALNWAANTAHRGERVPILFVCEDNGLGISVPTPGGWVEAATSRHPSIEHLAADGHDPAGVLDAAVQLVSKIRTTGQPGLLHLRTVRYLGHAGTDVETAYRSPDDIRGDLARDPIAATAALAVANGVCSPSEIAEWYLDLRSEAREFALALRSEPELASIDEIAAPLAPRRVSVVRERAEEIFPETDPDAEPLTLARTINHTLDQILTQHPRTLVFGEDVGAKGGVYGVTRGLQNRHGATRVFDTILDEQSILGLALGSAVDGFLPIPEIEYLAYLHNAEDQLRGEAATLSFFSQAQYRNPMVVRVASYGYQKGFGGHFHNDNSVAVLRDIPGIVIASPSHPVDAGAMLATCAAAADADGSVCVYLEPIARYHTVDLHEQGDGGWTAPPNSVHVPIGSARTIGDGPDGTILTWGNGSFLSQRAQRRLLVDHGERWRVVDLRWLAPLPVDDLVREAEATGRVLVVDETRHSGGVGEAVVAALVANDFRGPITRVSAADCFIPLGAAADLALVSEDQIVTAALG